MKKTNCVWVLEDKFRDKWTPIILPDAFFRTRREGRLSLPSWNDGTLQLRIRKYVAEEPK
jgi:hypothetical protein